MTVPQVKLLVPGCPVRTDRGLLGGASIVLFAGKQKVLYDVGAFGNRHPLQAALEDNKVKPEDIDIVILSHLHWDHALNVEAFPRAEFIISRQELEQAGNPVTRDSATPAFMVDVLKNYRLRVIEKDIELADGVRVMLMPGHTAGLLTAYAVDDEGVRHVVAGDAIPHASNGVSGENERTWFDAKQSKNSIKRLMEMGDIVYPAHDRPFRVKNGQVEYLFPYQITVRCRFDLDGRFTSVAITSAAEQETGWSK